MNHGLRSNEVKRSDWWQAEQRGERLVDMWERGVTTQAMADELGCTKNVVIGKVHRMGLEQRYVYAKPAPIREMFDPAACMWPIGHPGEEEFRFCGERSRVPGKPYCAKHNARAYWQPKKGERDQVEAVD